MERKITTEERRRQILCEATLLFAAEGYARAKVDDVADRLGVGKGTIYRYFPTKEALFLAVADNAMNDLQEVVKVVDQIENPFCRIETAVKMYLDFFDRNLHLFEIFVHERAEFRDRKESTCITYRDKNIRKLEELLADLKGDGFTRDIDVKVVAGMLGDLLYGTIYTQFLRGSKEKLAKLAPAIVELFFYGILNKQGQEAWLASRKTR